MKYTNFIEGNTRKVSVCFLHFHVCDIIEFQDDHACVHIRGKLTL